MTRREWRFGARSGVLAFAGSLFLLAAAVAPLPAQLALARCEADDVPIARAPAPWEPPLDRIVSLRASGEPLRRVLDSLSTAGGIRISYSDQVLPLDRPVCAAISDSALGDVLRYLIGGLAVDPIPVGSTHVVLSPAKKSTPSLAVAEPTVYELASVVATSSASRAAQLRASHAVTVVERDQLTHFGGVGLVRALNVLVPGFWSRPSPGGRFLGWSSMRGASSFGGSVPKVYLDGIEVADARLLADLTPDAVERVEVIRGPQGSALYGANAIGGVIHIVTRRGVPSADAPRAELRSSAVLRQDGPATDDLFFHDHALNLRAGDSRNWARMTFAAGTGTSSMYGDPGVDYSVLGNARIVAGPAILTTTSRFHLDDAAPGPSRAPAGGMLFGTPRDDQPATDSGTGRSGLTQYTLGATLHVLQSERWTHELVAGVDGYRLRDAVGNQSGSTLVTYASGPGTTLGAARTTLRLTSVLDLPTLDRSAASLSLTAEQRMSQRHTAQDGERLAPETRYAHASGAGAGWQKTTGFAGQANLSFDETLFVTAGLRLEGTSGTIRLTPLPQLGASLSTGGDQWSLRLRTAYGRAMSSPVDAAPKPTDHPFVTGLVLEPEMQAGIEAGISLELGDRIGLDVTRFDQTATNLVQRLDLGLRSSSGRVRHPNGGPVYLVQNVGEIANRGWEAQGRFTHDRLSVLASASTVDSRATQLPGGYSGDLRVGDRILGVPAYTAALAGGWHGDRWGLSLMLSRAWDWIDYDRQQLATDFDTAGMVGMSLPLPDLRDYWKRYDGSVAADASVDFHLTSRMGVTLRVDNLLDAPLADAHHLTTFSGRTAGVELRLRF